MALNPSKRRPLERFFCEMLGATDRTVVISRLVKRLAPANSNKAHRRLRDLFETGVCPQHLAERLAPLFPNHAPGFWKAVEQTRRQREAFEAEQARQRRERKIAAFRPHLYKRTERRVPSQICIVAFTGVHNWLHISLPESIANFGWQEQCALVARRLRSFEADSDTYPSELLFGKTIGYIYRPTYHTSYAVSLDGTIDPEDLGPFDEPEASLEVRGRKVAAATASE